MASSETAEMPTYVVTMRTLRNVTTAEDLIAAWPTLKAKALSSPPGVTEAERRMLLDLPDEDVESANIAIATNLSRDQLLEKAISHHEDLTSEEVAVLKNKFWTPRTREESKVYLKARKWISLEAIEEDCVLCQHLGPLEMAAFSIAMHEFWSRDRAAYNAKKAIIANGALPFAKKWIQDLYEQGKPIGVMWLLPGCVKVQRPDNEDNVSTDDETNYQRAAALRKAFKSIVDDPDEYQESDGVHPPYCGKTFTGNMKNGIAGSGLLTNTFLVIDPPCIDLVLSQSPFYDDLRVLVIEADFPVKGHEYVEGYEGFTWVRLDQLVYNFYELRMVRNGSTGMDEIWEAAQRSRNQAFVSMEAGEDHFTGSRRMAGFTRDSVLGKDFYPM
ncbi:hypothetical protein ONS95_006284 [Cadophora gregata]|uniref:uncharacterized protein n=1 Tax=Cadophora gregata TaxID=51156 RepID=UPI0026DC813F|nr:uncharacterized protein ONS95_006284 [Cadophora gregata]KAK0102682.1 hypothetical protein ONS95_006284 [Cadophora gregata]